MKYFSKFFSFIILAVLGQAFIFPVFAATTTSTSIHQEIYEIIHAFVSFLSWGWVIFATIAGKLMTNEFVYGKAIHLTNFMRRVWTIMRQFANYAIGILFLYHIFKTVFLQGEVANLKSALFGVVKASILINISRFAIAAMIDLSIVGVAAVGSLPAQILETRWDTIKQNFYVPEKYIIKRDDSKKRGIDVNTGNTMKELTLQDIVPQADNVTGPLFFMGVSVFQLFDKIYIPQDIGDLSALVPDVFLSLFIILLFTIPLIILAVVNMMRIFRLWIWIMLSPLIALDRSFNLELGKKSGNKKAESLFDPRELISLIFQPVVTIAALGFCLIFIIGIDEVVRGGSQAGLNEISKALCMTVDDPKTSTIDCQDGVSFVKIVGAGFGGTMLHMLLAILASFLLRGIVKISMSFSAITKGVSDGMYDFAEGALGAVPIPGTGMFTGGENVGYTAASQFGGDVKKAYTEKLNMGSNEAAENIINKAYEVAGLSTPTKNFNSDEKFTITQAIRKTSTPLEGLKSIATVVQNSPKTFQQIKEPLNQWLSQSTTQSWFTKNASRLGVTAESISDGKIYENSKFLGFIDAVLQGSDVVTAVSRGEKTTTIISNIEDKVYPKK